MVEIKIPIIGCANAGKTSLIRTLLREFKSLENLKPTKGIERSKFHFLNRDLILWDFGGQTKYIQEYKKKADVNFSEIEELIFVLDIQDQSVYNDVLNYFKEVITQIKEFSPSATINIIINKVDPGMETDTNILKLIETFNKKFTEGALGLPVRFASTSIFNPLSVIRAFSKPLFGNTTMYDNFSLLFMDQINALNLEFIMVMTPEFLEIGNYFAPGIPQQKMRNVSNEIIKQFDDKKMKLGDVSVQADSIMIKINHFEVGGKSFYFIYGYDVAKISDPSGIFAQIFNVLEDIKKFMKYL